MLMQGERDILRKWGESERTIALIEETVSSSDTVYQYMSLRGSQFDRKFTRTEAVEALGVVKFLTGIRYALKYGRAIRLINSEEIVVITTKPLLKPCEQGAERRERSEKGHRGKGYRDKTLWT